MVHNYLHLYITTDPKKVIKAYLMHKGKAVLIVSYETQRLYSKLFDNHMKISCHSGGNIGSSSSRTHNKINNNNNNNDNKSNNNNAHKKIVVGSNKTTMNDINDDHVKENLDVNINNIDIRNVQDDDQINHAVEDHDNDDSDGYYDELLRFHSNNSVCDLLICDEV